MDLSMLIHVGDKVRLNLLSQGEIYGTCVETSVLEFERKYLLRFDDNSEKWVTNYFVRYMATRN